MSLLSHSLSQTPSRSLSLPLSLFNSSSEQPLLDHPDSFLSVGQYLSLSQKMSPMQFREGPTPPADCWALRLNSERLFSELRLESERRFTYCGGRSADTLFRSSYYLETDRGATSPLFPLLKGSATLNPCTCSEHS